MEFRDNVIRIIRSIPVGKVISYGQIAALAGNHRASRQVSWILKNSDAENLPWHRVINSKGKISLPPQDGGIVQKGLLESEGVRFTNGGITIDKSCFWSGPNLY